MKHGVDKSIQLLEMGIDARRHPKPFELCMLDGDRDDLVLLPEPVVQGSRIDPLQLDISDPAGELRAKACVQPKPVVFQKGVGPVVPQIPEPGFLPLATQALMEGEGLSDGQVVGCRVGSDLLILP